MALTKLFQASRRDPIDLAPVALTEGVHIGNVVYYLVKPGARHLRFRPIPVIRETPRLLLRILPGPARSTRAGLPRSEVLVDCGAGTIRAVALELKDLK